MNNDSSSIWKQLLVMNQTYRLNWEVIQEFTLPQDHACSSVDVNEALGEIMFACRHKGLLHYKWNSNSGLVQATKQPHRVTNYGRNCRLVTCCSDGSYLVLNHRQLRYFRLASNRAAYVAPILQQQHQQHQLQQFLLHQQQLQQQPEIMQQQQEQQQPQSGRSEKEQNELQQQTLQPTQLQEAEDSRTSVFAAESTTIYNRSALLDFVEYLDQAVCVGDVRSMAADKQADSVMLLFPDRLTSRSLSDLSDWCVFDRSYSLTEELFNVQLSRQFIYMMNSAGDIMLRYRSECYEKGDQLLWRTIGSRAFASPGIIEQQANINRQICLSSKHYLQLLDSESPVSLLGMACDPGRQIVFAATGGPQIYAVWHPDLEPDLTDSGWGQNWLEDTLISLAVIGPGDSSAPSSRSTKSHKSGQKSHSPSPSSSPSSSPSPRPSAKAKKKKKRQQEVGHFIPGPMTCSSGCSSSRGAYLYVVDAASGAKVMVIRYTTETARIG